MALMVPVSRSSNGSVFSRPLGDWNITGGNAICCTGRTANAAVEANASPDGTVNEASASGEVAQADAAQGLRFDVANGTSGTKP